MGDKRETSVNSCGPRNPEWETSVGDKCGRQVWETRGRQGGDKCKLMRPKEPRVGDKCGRQGGDKCKLMQPRHPEWETSVGDKIGRQVWATSAGDKWEASVNSCGPRPRVPDKGETSVNSCGPRHPEWETRGRQV